MDRLLLPGGYVQPGQVLLKIQDCFADARSGGVTYDRVLVASVGRWDALCPFVRDDAGFGRALMDLLRCEGASVVFVCGPQQCENDSRLQRTVVDRANALLEFESIEFMGARRNLIRIARPIRDEDWHEVSLQEGRLQVERSLLRVKEQGPNSPPRAQAVRTTLLLYQVSREQANYHRRVASRLRSILTTPVSVRKIDRAVLTEAAHLGPLSVGSSLRVVQIDEFQLPALKHSSGGRCLLHPFPAAMLRDRWADSPRVLKAVTRQEPGRSADPGTVVALPYYTNIGLLCVDQKYADQVGDAHLDWHAVARLSSRSWDKLFFDCAKRPEDYNCLFFEIALSLKTRGSPPGIRDSDFPKGESAEESWQCLREWIKNTAFTEALELFHTVCAPAHLTNRKTRDALLGPAPESGIISRHWCTALRHWLTERGRADASGEGTVNHGQARIAIHPLPGNVAISGEWYLGVWAHSAVPQIGFQILENLTSTEAQLERMWHGIGLPVSEKLLANTLVHFLPNAVPTPNLDLGQLVRGAKRRSDLYNYPILSPILGRHLIQLLESTTKPSMKATASNLLRDFEQVRTSPV